jgi:CheY-like chemotaxis protein
LHEKEDFRALSAKRVLIVDDNPDLRRMLAALLERRGYMISLAASGKEAIQRAISAKPDLVLLDLKLPDMSGMDAARALLKNPQTAQIPIVGCSASWGPEWREAAMSAGMVEYLEKPLPFGKIETIIEQAILLQRQPSPRLRKSIAQAGKLYLSRKFKRITFRVHFRWQ